MILPDDDALAAALRDALHAAADPFEPEGDGLQRIQRRLAAGWPERLARRLLARLADLAWLIGVRLEPLADWLRSAGRARPGDPDLAARPWLRLAWSVGAAARQAWPAARQAWPAALALSRTFLADPAVRSVLPWPRRRTPAHASPSSRAARRSELIALLRSAVAVASAVAIVVSGFYALSQLHLTAIVVTQQTGTPTEPLTPSASPAGSAARHPRRSSPAPTPSGVPARTRRPHRRTIPLPTCSPLPTLGPTSQPTPSPTPSPVPTGSATPTASPGATGGTGVTPAKRQHRVRRTRC